MNTRHPLVLRLIVCLFVDLPLWPSSQCGLRSKDLLVCSGPQASWLIRSCRWSYDGNVQLLSSKFPPCQLIPPITFETPLLLSTLWWPVLLPIRGALDYLILHQMWSTIAPSCPRMPLTTFHQLPRLHVTRSGTPVPSSNRLLRDVDARQAHIALYPRALLVANLRAEYLNPLCCSQLKTSILAPRF